MKITITVTIEPGTAVSVPTDYPDLSAFLTAHTAEAVNELLPDPATDAAIAVVVESDQVQ
jgi:hypothetical protein